MAKIVNEYFLMHKDVPVCLMNISEDGELGAYRVNKAALDHFPLGGKMNEMKEEFDRFMDYEIMTDYLMSNEAEGFSRGKRYMESAILKSRTIRSVTSCI